MEISRSSSLFGALAMAAVLLTFQVPAAHAQSPNDSIEKRAEIVRKAFDEQCQTKLAVSEAIAKGNADAAIKPLAWLGLKFGGETTLKKSEVKGFTEEVLKTIPPAAMERQMDWLIQCRQEYIQQLLQVLNRQLDFARTIVAVDSKGYVPTSIHPTNAEKIRDILTRQGDIEYRIFAVRAYPVDWDNKVVIALEPRVILLHWSAFEDENRVELCSIAKYDPNASACVRLTDQLHALLKNSRARILLYTRTADACKYASRFLSTASHDGRIPLSERNRITVFEMAYGKRASSFETEATKSDLRRAVSWLVTPGKLPDKPPITGLCRPVS